MKPKKRLRLILEFETKKELLEWIEEYDQTSPMNVAAYSADVLDKIQVDDRTYWLRRVGSRPESYRLK